MICRFCGEEFEQNKRGRQSDFCSKEECRKARHREHQKKYMEKKKNKSYATIEPREGLAVNENFSPTERDVVCRKEIKDNYGDIAEKARQIGKLRYELVTEAIIMQEEIKKTDQLEQDLLHMLENADELTEKDAINISVLIKQNRNKRREFKDRNLLISSLLNGIVVKNPEKFVRKGIEMVKSQTYNYKVLKDMLNEDLEEKEVGE